MIPTQYPGGRGWRHRAISVWSLSVWLSPISLSADCFCIYWVPGCFLVSMLPLLILVALFVSHSILRIKDSLQLSHTRSKEVRRWWGITKTSKSTEPGEMALMTRNLSRPSKWQFIDLHSPAQALSYSALVNWSVCMSCYKGTLCPLLYVFFHLLLLLDHSTYFLIWGYTRPLWALQSLSLALWL